MGPALVLADKGFLIPARHKPLILDGPPGSADCLTSWGEFFGATMNLLLIRCLLVGALATLLACGGGGGGGSSAPPAAASSVPTLASVKPAQGPVGTPVVVTGTNRSEEHTSELQSLRHLVC